MDENGCFAPLKSFKHAAQSFYNKIKGGVDGATQQRAIIRSDISHLKWEQKIFPQMLKTLAIYSFYSMEDVSETRSFESEELFRSTESYRNKLKKVQPTVDFMFNVAQQLLSYASSMKLNEQSVDCSEDVLVSSNEDAKRLIELNQSKKRNMLYFFDSSDGIQLRPSVKCHYETIGDLQHFALCRVHTEGYEGHRTKRKCMNCSLHLCLKIPPGYKKSCSQIWHTQKHSQARRFPHKAPSASQSGEGTSGSGAVSRIQESGKEASVGEVERSSTFSGGEEGNDSAFFGSSIGSRSSRRFSDGGRRSIRVTKRIRKG